MLFVYIDLLERLLRYLKPFVEKMKTAESSPSPPPPSQPAAPQPSAPPPQPGPAAACVGDQPVALNKLTAELVLDNIPDPNQAARDQELEKFVEDRANGSRNRGTKVSGKIYRLGGRILVYGPVRMNKVLWGEVFDEFGTEYQIDMAGG